MKNMKELFEEHSKLLEEYEILNLKTRKQKTAVENISHQIAKLKEQQDYSSFKFVHANVQLILQKITPKHKIPSPREINLQTEANSATPMTASIPWAKEECSDENPCNVGVCDRCNVLHFHTVLGKMLAGYYAK